MNPLDNRPHLPRASIRLDARLDAVTWAKLEDLAAQFRRSHAAVLQQVMRWGLGREPSGQLGRDDTQGPLQHFFFIVDFELYRQVRGAAESAATEVACWLRDRLRAVTVVDFPASWQAGDAPRRKVPGDRSHDSRAYGKRFMMRLGARTWETLEGLSQHFDKSSAEIIRQLLAKATLKVFPRSWHLAAEERRREVDE